MVKPRKILLIAYYAPPVQVTGNIRRFHLFQEFQQHFSQLFILTSSNGVLMRQDPSLTLSGIPVFPIPTYDLRRLLLSPKKQKGPTLDTRVKSNRGFRWLRRISDSFPFNLFLDDGGLIYIWRAYLKACQLIQQESIQYIFSSFRPAADHVVAYLLKRKFPQLIWIADFRDLPVDPIRKNVLLPNWQNRWQSFALKRAHILTTVSQGLATHLERYHSRVYVLPNAIPNTNLANEVLLFQDRFTLSYTGSLYPDLQDLKLLFSCIQSLLKEGKINLSQIQLIYAGKDATTWNKYINQYELQLINNNKGLISYDEARLLQQKSHINILLSWSSTLLAGVLMAKQASYLAALRPIIALINGPRDTEFERQFRVLNAGSVFYSPDKDVSTKLKAHLLDHYSIWLNTGSLPSSISHEQLESLGWELQVSKLMAYLSTSN